MTVNNVAIYPGSFDPITNGHVDLVKRTLRPIRKKIGLFSPSMSVSRW